MEDFLAWLHIFKSNFTASFGTLFNLLLMGAFFALAANLIIRANRLKSKGAKSRPLKTLSGDPKLLERASQSLSRAIQFETLPQNGAEMQRFWDYVKERYPLTFKKLSCMPVPGGSMLLRYKTKRPSGLEPALFCGHIDVAPPGEGWDRDPFSGETDDGMIFGRGAVDCKGVIIAQLEALESLLSEGYEPRRDLYFAYGSDEETGGQNGALIMGALLKRRGVRFELILDEGGFIAKRYLGEKTLPAALIGVAEKGGCSIKLTAHETCGHLWQLKRHTPLGQLAEAVCRIEAAPLKPRLLPVIEQHLLDAAQALSFWQRLWLSNLRFGRRPLLRQLKKHPTLGLLLRSTMVPTQAEGSSLDGIFPLSASVVIHCRILQGDSAQGLCTYIGSLLSDLNIEVELLRETPPSSVSPIDSESYQLLCRAVSERFVHLKCIPTIVPGGTDSVHYQDLSQNIFRFSPFVLSDKALSGVHGKNEYLRQNSLLEAVEFYRVLFNKL